MAIEQEYIEKNASAATETFKVGHRMQHNVNWQKDDKRKRKYVGSEVFAEDVLEDVCAALGGVSQAVGHRMMEDFMNETMHTNHTRSVAARLGNSAASFCNTVVEEHEEEIKEQIMKGEMFLEKHIGTRLKRWLCYRKSSICDANQLEVAGTGLKLPDEFTQLLTADLNVQQKEQQAHEEAQDSAKQEKINFGKFGDTLQRMIQRMRWYHACGLIVAVLLLIAPFLLEQSAPAQDYTEQIKLARLQQEEKLRAAKGAADRTAVPDKKED